MEAAFYCALNVTSIYRDHRHLMIYGYLLTCVDFQSCEYPQDNSLVVHNSAQGMPAVWVFRHMQRARGDVSERFSPSR